MYLSLAPLIARGLDVLPELLQALATKLGSDFSVAADCGAGIGGTSTAFLQALKAGATSPRVYCYEPLPENVAVLQTRLGDDSAFVVRPVAVSDEAGEARFSVPSRVPNDWGDWKAGTSYNGFLADPSQWHEQITVPTVRLADEGVDRFDFVKLDLQGGELKAIKGLADKLRYTKLLYVEAQLLEPAESVTFLRRHGFIILFDKIQFGITGRKIDARRLASFGIILDHLHILPVGDGEVAAFGYLADSGILDLNTLSIKASVVKELRELGLNYIQTDALAIHPNVASIVFEALAQRDFGRG